MPTGYRGDQAGKYGLMPYAQLERKWEVTGGLFEDPDQVELYQRGLLRDTTPDPPFMDAHIPRNGQYDPHTGEARGGNQFARQQLTLRETGGRSMEEPDHSEAFLELTERDPRGTNIEPDIRRAVVQSWMRGYDQHLYDDTDASVPESGVGHAQMRDNIRSGFYPTKERMKIFDTSADGRVASTMMPKPVTSGKILVMPGQEVADITKLPSWNRRDATTLNDLLRPVGAGMTSRMTYTTPSQQYKVAHYGRPRSLVHIADVHKNRAYAMPDIKFVESRGQSVPRQLAREIAWLSHLASRRPYAADGGIRFGYSKVVDPQPPPLHIDPMTPNPRIQAVGSQVRPVLTESQLSKIKRLAPRGAGEHASAMAKHVIASMPFGSTVEGLGNPRHRVELTRPGLIHSVKLSLEKWTGIGKNSFTIQNYPQKKRELPKPATNHHEFAHDQTGSAGGQVRGTTSIGPKLRKLMGVPGTGTTDTFGQDFTTFDMHPARQDHTRSRKNIVTIRHLEEGPYDATSSLRH
jgi:hypothetical protein